jgi:hypothetical protein
MGETKDKLREVEEMCRVKDEEIKRQENTITTLNSMHLKHKRNIEHQMEEIVREKQHLDQEKAKQEKRITAALAEETLKLRKEFDQLVENQGQFLRSARKSWKKNSLNKKTKTAGE